MLLYTIVCEILGFWNLMFVQVSSVKQDQTSVTWEISGQIPDPLDQDLPHKKILRVTGPLMSEKY